MPQLTNAASSLPSGSPQRQRAFRPVSASVSAPLPRTSSSDGPTRPGSSIASPQSPTSGGWIRRFDCSFVCLFVPFCLFIYAVHRLRKTLLLRLVSEVARASPRAQASTLPASRLAPPSPPSTPLRLSPWGALVAFCRSLRPPRLHHPPTPPRLPPRLLLPLTSRTNHLHP